VAPAGLGAKLAGLGAKTLGLGKPGCDAGRCAGREHRLGQKTGGQTSGHEVVAFDQEGALALTVLADVQRRRSLDERVLSARKGG
jgi:hypothetical protein